MTKKKIKKEPVANDSPMSLYDRMIAIGEKTYGPNNKFVRQLKKNKELGLKNKGKSFREIYSERQTFTFGHQNKKVKTND